MATIAECIGRTVLEELAPDLVTEATTKDGLPASSYLVVEDPEQTTTWHLAVRDAEGKPDHRLLGSAWAALHKGFRGNVYEGPQKVVALAKLKTLYKTEKMVVPSEAALSEMYGEAMPALTLADAMALEKAEEFNEEISGLTDLFFRVANNILWSSESPRSTGAQLVALAQELADELGRMAGPEGEAEMETEAVVEAVVEVVEELAETEAPVEEVVEEAAEEPSVRIVIEEGSVPSLQSLTERGAILEAQSIGEPSRRGPLRIRTALIRAGAGNAKDNHYYPQAVLEAAAGKFTNAKMYQTQHVDSEKNVNTEASFVQQVVGYDPDHGLVADVVAYDPSFCEKVRNLQDVGRMDMLQCSIVASGTAQKGKVDEKDFQVVSSIDEVYSVDWVTWGGAGGHAITAEPVEAVVMEKQAIVAFLDKSRLPSGVKAMLAEREYEDEATLTDVVSTMTEELAALIPSVADNNASPAPEEPMTEADVNARVLAANKRNLG